MRLGWLGLGLVLAACVSPPSDRPRSATPYEAAVAGAMAAKEISTPQPEDTRFGWRLAVAGDTASFLECASEETCTDKRVELPADAVHAVKVVGRARPVLADGTTAEEVDVVRITILRERWTKRGGAATDARGLVVR